MFLLRGAKRKPRGLQTVLVDGSPLLHRAFHATPPLQTSSGQPINAVLTFTRTLLSLRKQFGAASHMAVAVDIPRKETDLGRSSFRHGLFPDYKGSRAVMAPELVSQLGLVREAIKASGIQAIGIEDYEADDVIASYATEARNAGHTVKVVSPDKDLLQLVEPDGSVEVYDPRKRRHVKARDVESQWGVLPAAIPHLQALAGDKVDNIPGVPGIGPKRAAFLLNNYGHGTIDGLLTALDSVKPIDLRDKVANHKDTVIQALALTTLVRDIDPLPMALDELKAKPVDGEALADFALKYEMNSLLAAADEFAVAAGRKRPSETTMSGVRVPLGQTGLRRSATGPGSGRVIAPILEVDDEERSADQSVEEIPWTASIAYADGATEWERVSGTWEALELPRASEMRRERNWDGSKVNHGFVGSLEEFDQVLGRIRRAGRFIFSLWPGDDGKLAGVSLAEGEDTWYVPIRHTGEEEPLKKDCDSGLVLERVQSLFRDENVMKVGHDVKGSLRHLDIKDPFDDVMVMGYVLACGSTTTTLEGLGKRYTGKAVETWEPLKTLTGIGKKRVPWQGLEVGDGVANHTGARTAMIGQLHRFFARALLDNRSLGGFYSGLERPLVKVLGDVEAAGVYVHASELEAMRSSMEEDLAAREARIHELAGHEFNVRSPKQLGEVLFGELGLGGGSAGTSETVLSGLAKEGHEIAAEVLKHRATGKLLSTYVEGLLGQVSEEDGRIHTTYMNALTQSGRLSSVSPNLQNIPNRSEAGRAIRNAFGAAPGHVLLCCDYSQVELRIFAEIAHIDSLKEAFQKGEDVHTLTASQVFGLEREAVDKATRQRAKAINFGIIYGMSEYGLARTLEVGVGEARDFIGKYFAQYPGIRKYMDETKAGCAARGYVETAFGRRCWVPAMSSSNPAVRSAAARVAINTPIQGTSADITKIAMLRCGRAFSEQGLGTRMIMQIHDEVVFEAPEAEAEQVKPLIKTLMEGARPEKWEIPFPVEIRQSSIWGGD